MYILFSTLLRKALSSSQGELVDASKNTFSLSWDQSPSSWISSSVFSLRLASCSPAQSRAIMMESISSMKIVEGWLQRAISKRTRRPFSDSPWYLDISDEAEMLKKTVLHSCATALASIVFPVPGGPNSRTPLQGWIWSLSNS